MFPKVGDVVRLNPDFLKIFFKRGNKYLKEDVWKGKFPVTEIIDLKNEFGIEFESKDDRYILHILSNGEFSTCSNEYEGIQVFIPTDLEKNNNDIYCSCGGPKKENYVFGERFYVCTICKKEVI